MRNTAKKRSLSNSFDKAKSDEPDRVPLRDRPLGRAKGDRGIRCISGISATFKPLPNIALKLFDYKTSTDLSESDHFFMFPN